MVQRYGDVIALDRVSLDVAAGQSVALVGESGSGKTTLLRCFNRLVEPTSGAISVGGSSVRDRPSVALRRMIGYVPQDGGLMPHWRILRNVALVPTLLGIPNASAVAIDTLALVGLPAERFGARFPHELSGGQRQRAALARALAARPGVVLMDEPFGALDAITRSDLQAAFDALRHELSFTMLDGDARSGRSGASRGRAGGDACGAHRAAGNDRPARVVAGNAVRGDAARARARGIGAAAGARVRRAC